MNKSKVILSAILVIALCASLVCGATFALFTSESKVNIAVTSGKVAVVATVENLKTYSGESLTGVVSEDEEKIAATETNGEFANGGTATFSAGSENTITLANLTPGDRVTFDIKVSNSSNVKVMYRTIITCEEDNGLFYGLVAKLDGEQISGRVVKSIYADLEVGTEDMVVPVSVELPSDAGNEYQGKTCKISYVVEAVQGNAFNGIYNVDPTTVQAALDKASDGDTIILGEGNYGTLYFRQSGKSVKYASSATGSDLVHVDGEKITYNYHPGRTDVTYMRTLKNITIVGSENAKVDDIVFMDGMYKYAEDAANEISGNIIYSDENTVTDHGSDTDYDNRLISLFTIKNLLFKDINFTGAKTALKISYCSYDAGLEALTWRYTIDGLYFDGCSMTVSEETDEDRMLLKITTGSRTGTYYKNVSIENCTISADRVLVVDGVENLSIINNKFTNIKNRDLNFSQGGNMQPVVGNVIISGNTSDGSKERFIRIGDASQMNLVIANNTITNYQGADDDFIKVTGVALSKTIINNNATAADGRTLTINVA